MKESYELRLYDQTLIAFTLMGSSTDYTAEIDHTYEPAELYPLGLKISGEDILRWISRRVIPRKRAFAYAITQTLGLGANATKGIMDVSRLLSLTDSYWVVPKGFKGKFADFNLYENRFSEVLSLVAFTGVIQEDPTFFTSPELTTDGVLPKAWRYIENDGIYLYKRGTVASLYLVKEPYIEYYASQIAETMELNAVHYDLEIWEDIPASKCRLFTDIHTSFVPIGRIEKSGRIAAVVNHYDTLGRDFSDAVRDMLVFDALIYNEDRHFGNFGLLRDNRTGKIKAPAPIFDNGNSLFRLAGPDDYSNLEEYAEKLCPVYSNFDDIGRSFITPRQAEKLRKMANFSFTRHPKLNLPEEHLKSMEIFLRKRASQLIEIAETQ